MVVFLTSSPTGSLDGKYMKPDKELKGFKKINLNQGEKKNITIDLENFVNN